MSFKGAIMPDGSILHSPLGASSAERWLNCPGSVALIQALGPQDDDGSGYAAEGTLAHSLAAHCLNHEQDCWEALADFPAATGEMSRAVQTYLDYVRAIPSDDRSRRYVELGVSNQEFHPQMFGMLDYALLHYSADGLSEFVDYKHGIGVVVVVEDNPQLKYYVFALIDGEEWPADLPRLPDEHRIRLTIVQPRAYAEAVRSWDTTAGAIREWAKTELHAAMEKAGEHTYRLGEWCRFCPAKDALVCPAQRTLGVDAALAAHEVATLPDRDDEWLGQWYGRLNELKMFVKAIGDEASRRLLAGKTVPGAKLVFAKVDRVWKEGADAAIIEAYGNAAWKPVELLSPAQAGKLPGGAEFVAEWAMKPQAALTVAPESDKRPAQAIKSDAEVFAGVEIPA